MFRLHTVNEAVWLLRWGLSLVSKAQGSSSGGLNNEGIQRRLYFLNKTDLSDMDCDQGNNRVFDV